MGVEEFCSGFWSPSCGPGLEEPQVRAVRLMGTAPPWKGGLPGEGPGRGRWEPRQERSGGGAAAAPREKRPRCECGCPFVPGDAVACSSLRLAWAVSAQPPSPRGAGAQRDRRSACWLWTGAAEAGEARERCGEARCVPQSDGGGERSAVRRCEARSEAGHRHRRCLGQGGARSLRGAVPQATKEFEKALCGPPLDLDERSRRAVD
ncbi:uncharacterized protein LOC142039433 [Buteo buteo]|uniref:uncharacterized protein LOC142039433 n=1 Tax=Buteo buteo TaxID=30397 RepID=UPI003EB807C1